MTTPDAPARRRRAPVRFGQAAWDTVRLFVVRVLVEPVREGRLRDTDWPVGLRPIVLVALIGYVVAVALVLGGSLIRQQLDLFVQAGGDSIPIPREALWIVMALTALAVSLAQAGAVHARPWARWLVTAFTVLVLLLVGLADLGDIAIAKIVAVAASVGIIVLTAVRGHRRFAWWEFSVIAGLVFGSIAVSIAVIALASKPLGFDFVPITVTLVLITIGQLAVPAAIAAGAAVAELAVSSAVWAAGVTRDRLGRRAVIVLLAIVVVWRVVDLVQAGILIAADPLVEVLILASAAGFIGLVALLWLLIAKVRAAGAAPTTAGLITTLSTVSLLIAAFLTLSIPSGLLQLGGFVVRTYTGRAELEPFIKLVSTISSSPIAVGATGALAGAGLIGLSFLLARRGREVLPELLAAIGIGSLVSGVSALIGFSLVWSAEALSVVATLAAIGVTVWLVVTKRATTERLAAVTGALLIAALFAHREFISDPLAALIGSAATATILLGFVWALLTGSGPANGDSPGYPRPARVLLLLGNAIFGATVLAYVSLARDPESSLNLAPFVEVGAQSFGDPLIAAALLVALGASIRGRELN